MEELSSDAITLKQQSIEKFISIGGRVKKSIIPTLSVLDNARRLSRMSEAIVTAKYLSIAQTSFKEVSGLAKKNIGITCIRFEREEPDSQPQLVVVGTSGGTIRIYHCDMIYSSIQIR